MSDGTTDEAWVQALDRLEADLTAAECAARGQYVTVEPWSPPVLPLPMPATLRLRARDLVVRQRALGDALTAVRAGIGRQGAVTSRMHQAVSPRGTQPIYIDVKA